MEQKTIEQIVKKQRDFFYTGKTLPLNYRIEQLKLLYDTIKKYEVDIALALKSDLGKSSFESYMCEIGLVLSEITYMLKNIRKFAAKHKVPTPLSQYDAVSYKQACPYGNVLIMSPWNYPFLLTLDPLVDAMAAGNTAIVKPSAYSSATSQVIKKIVEECFPPEYVAVITGGRAENTSLLQQKFDFIFFTGSQSVGKEVLHSAAEYLTPAVLELGGKSPCIVDDTAKIKLAAKRIVFGKFLNCGQTCVAPDYVLCQEDIASQLVDEICKEIKLQYTDKPLENSLYGNIINEKHFERISALIDKNKVVLGGDTDAETMQIEPTVMTEVTWNDAVMQQEIFGPVLPILTFDKLEDVFEILKDRPKPLALYIFSENKGHIKAVTEKCRYGGGCINDTIIHLASSEMGFGGVGESGMGSYHGKEGFEAFSHTKSIVNKKTWIDLPMRYQPYKEKYRKIVNFFLK
jgi:aldehyde dehydrogenase (NAD+)